MRTMEYFWDTLSGLPGRTPCRFLSALQSQAPPCSSLCGETSRLARARRNLSVAREILHGPSVVAFAFGPENPRANFKTNASGKCSFCCVLTAAKRTWTAASYTKQDARRRDQAPEAFQKGSPKHSAKMSALVNANTRVGMGHTTRAQRSMLAAKESARQRHDDARAFLDPMKRNLHRNAWEERNAQRLDRRKREEEAAAIATQEREAAEVEERRKRLEELYKREQAAWAASPKKQEPVEDDLERARKIDARRKEEQSEAREIARARLEAYRRAQTPEYRAAERLKQMHLHNEQRNQDRIEHASVPKAAAPCAVKTELVNDHFVPSEHKAPNKNAPIFLRKPAGQMPLAPPADQRVPPETFVARHAVVIAPFERGVDPLATGHPFPGIGDGSGHARGSFKCVAIAFEDSPLR